MKIVFFGGTRYVGKELVNLMEASSHKVYIASSHKPNFSKKGILFSKLDRTDKNRVGDLLAEVKPDIIFDNICFNEYSARIIQDTYAKQLKACLKHYIMTSTFYVYNYSKKRECYINFKAHKIKDDYTRNKLAAESSLYNSSLYKIATIVRFPFVVSHDDYTNRFQKLVKNIRNSKSMQLSPNCKYKMSFISKSEAAKFMHRLINSKPSGFVDAALKLI
ncbi:NAD-dependent epimerase/dehydratase family protein [Thermoproteota archaeon]